MARISVVSASIAPRPGVWVRAMIHAIGTPMTRQINTANPENMSELMMNLGVSMLTCLK